MEAFFLWWIAQWPTPLTIFRIQLCWARVTHVRKSMMHQAPKQLKLLA